MLSSSYNGICFKIRICCHSCINIEGCISERKVVVPRRKKEWKVFLALQCAGSSTTIVPRIPIVKWVVAFDLPCVYFHVSVFSTNRKYEQLLEKHFSSNTKPHFEYLSKFLLIQTYSLFSWPFLL